MNTRLWRDSSTLRWTVGWLLSAGLWIAFLWRTRDSTGAPEWPPYVRSPARCTRISVTGRDSPAAPTPWELWSPLLFALNGAFGFRPADAEPPRTRPPTDAPPLPQPFVSGPWKASSERSWPTEWLYRTPQIPRPIGRLPPAPPSLWVLDDAARPVRSPLPELVGWTRPWEGEVVFEVSENGVPERIWFNAPRLPHEIRADVVRALYLWRWDATGGRRLVRVLLSHPCSNVQGDSNDVP